MDVHSVSLTLPLSLGTRPAAQFQLGALVALWNSVRDVTRL